jgi:diguanylate cyclase (GGDEF)-like protein
MFSFGKVLDRRSFLTLLDLEIRKARRYGASLSVLSFTFGQVNPSPGKKFSNSLKTLANLLSGALRDTDIVAQDGENRLLVMLPYANAEVTDKVRQRLEKSLQEHAFEREGITIEIDEACFPIHATNANDLLRIARGNINGNRP